MATSTVISVQNCLDSPSVVLGQDGVDEEVGLGHSSNDGEVNI